MASIKPSVPKGTRDFSPTEMVRRNFIFDTIKSVFRKYGYQQIETPSMENLSTLTGKYGDEGDKLLFRIINSGNPYSDLILEEVQTLWKEALPDKSSISELIQSRKNESIESQKEKIEEALDKFLDESVFNPHL